MPVLAVPVAMTVGVGLLSTAVNNRWIRLTIAVVSAVLAVRGLGQSFDTGDGVCTDQWSTLTGTVRGSCFQQPKMMAAALWSLACAAIALALPFRA
jgi:hypothetical protein